MNPNSHADNPTDFSGQIIPTHIAIIMDGNGRWAVSRGLPRLAGHRAGTENLRRIIEACIEFGVQYLTIYAFSTENWGRPVDEVQGLMKIIEHVIDFGAGAASRPGRAVTPHRSPGSPEAGFA